MNIREGCGVGLGDGSDEDGLLDDGLKVVGFEEDGTDEDGTDVLVLDEGLASVDHKYERD